MTKNVKGPTTMNISYNPKHIQNFIAHIFEDLGLIFTRFKAFSSYSQRDHQQACKQIFKQVEGDKVQCL